jgi:hypothetical protein
VRRDTVAPSEEVLVEVSAMVEDVVSVVVGPGAAEVLDSPLARRYTEPRLRDMHGATDLPTRAPSLRCSGTKPNRCEAHWMI